MEALFDLLHLAYEEVVPFLFHAHLEILYLVFQVFQITLVFLALDPDEEQHAEPQDQAVPQVPENEKGEFVHVYGHGKKGEDQQHQAPEQHHDLLRDKIVNRSKASQKKS